MHADFLFINEQPKSFSKINLFSVCETPPAAQANAVTIPSNLTGQFLAGDTIDYSCNGALIPSDPTTLTCIDDAPLAKWLPDTETMPLPDCSK